MGILYYTLSYIDMRCNLPVLGWLRLLREYLFPKILLVDACFMENLKCAA